ncbi:classical arabinogalactan protein 4 [Stenotrophomonas sp. PS02298]|uniref:classical arabinogalactan protein 4 n=1 Tax=Stenotrophomonas sp. PS02298 TaxID=2991424 RepID=UPI00249B35E0|nr:classical arabinogalactan protein 4 [Stenotrophomonas sp. PS02298]
MKRMTYLTLAVLAIAPLSAQAQLQQPPSPTATRPVTLPPPSRPPATAPSDQRQEEVRPLPPRPAAQPKPAPKAKPITQPAQPVRPIYDSKGQPTPHMRQTSPGRVLDTRTNRYYDTVPSGVGQQVVPPPAGAR